MSKRGAKQPGLEFWQNTLSNAFKLWFTPEVESRIAAGELSSPANIWGAQVILEPGKPIAVHLNEQLQGVFAISFKDPAYSPAKGAIPDLSQIKSIDGVTLTDSHPNAGHFTVVFYEPFPFIAFDFRYNATRIGVLLARANEFHASARGSLRRREYSAFTENLFAEVELLAKAVLAHHSDERLFKGVSHKFVKSEINRYAKRGNLPPRFVVLHNQLAQLRSRARYGEVAFTLNHDVAAKMLRTARALYRYVEARRPRRWQKPAA